MSGRQLAGFLTAIALLTFVLPPLAARRVNEARVARSHAEAARIAELAAEDDGSASGLASVADRLDPLALSGPGDTPKFTTTAGWPAPRATTALSARPDPWGNCYIIVMPARGHTAAVVLSAGPNGVVETKFGALTGAGDDIVATRPVR